MFTIRAKLVFADRNLGNFCIRSSRKFTKLEMVWARRMRTYISLFCIGILQENYKKMSFLNITQTFVFGSQNFCFRRKQKSPSQNKSTLMVNIVGEQASRIKCYLNFEKSYVDFQYFGLFSFENCEIWSKLNWKRSKFAGILMDFFA